MKKTLCTLLLFTVLGAPTLAAPSLAGTTLCLSPDLSTWPTGKVPNALVFAERLYADIKTRFRQQGVRFSEDRACRKAADGAHPDFTLKIDMGEPTRDGRREAKVGLDVVEQVPNSFQGRYLYSKVTYLSFSANEEPTARLTAAARSFLDDFVRSWRDANR